MAYLVAITRDVNAAEEIFQNAAVIVMEKSATDETINDFRAWAKEIVRRQALSYIQKQVRSEQKVRSIEPVLLEQITRTFMDDKSTSQTENESAALITCVSQLASSDRDMLRQRYTNRMSFAAIGESIGKTEGAVQRAISRIRQRLHDCVVAKLKLAEL